MCLLLFSPPTLAILQTWNLLAPSRGLLSGSMKTGGSAPVLHVPKQRGTGAILYTQQVLGLRPRRGPYHPWGLESVGSTSVAWQRLRGTILNKARSSEMFGGKTPKIGWAQLGLDW